ncbi:GRAS family protein RAM1-like [Apium graveolens]|uniref:Uncharacterized protein n=1 Tax=Apium graveolens TaxID=4045 RepID=A0A6L5BBI2_APIGR|nr:hypothetical protein AG4045_009079 [Apium graveolens]
MEDTDEQEEFLTLTLAIVADSKFDTKRKRRKREASVEPVSSNEEYRESKIFSLLQLREQMLKLDHKRKGVAEDGKGLHLVHLLLISATFVDENKLDSCIESLSELFRYVCFRGDSVQRVATYFADALVARLLTRKSPFYNMIVKEPTAEEEFSAFTELYTVSPYYQFAHFTANQAIIEAFEKEERFNNRVLHVIDFDVSYGFQWPSLIQSLADKAASSNRISLRITAFGRRLEELQETETRLVCFAKGIRNIVFEFQGLLRGSSNFSNVKRKNNETVAVNLVFHLNTLTSVSKISDTLKSVHFLNPAIVILVEQEASRNPRSFLAQFMESLHFFAAMFDSLDDCLPLDSEGRLRIEKNHLGREIKRFMNYEKDTSNCIEYERMKTWKERMEGHGFRGVKLSSRSVMQAKLLLKMRSQYCPVQCDGENGGFRVFERDESTAISLGWQDRFLLTASAWHRV